MAIKATYDFNGSPLPIMQPSVAQSVNVAAASGASAAVQTEAVRLVSTVDCYFAIGAAPVATTNDFYLPAGVPYDIRLPVGWKVAVIRASVDGVLKIIEWA